MVILPIGLENGYSADFLKGKVLFGFYIKTSINFRYDLLVVLL